MTHCLDSLPGPSMQEGTRIGSGHSKNTPKTSIRYYSSLEYFRYLHIGGTLRHTGKRSWSCMPDTRLNGINGIIDTSLNIHI